MPPENTDTSDERAVESGQLSRAGSADSDKVQKVQIETTGYFEPPALDKLAKYGRLYLIADGLTGGSFGQIAAHYTIKKILHDFYTGDVSDDPKARLLEVIQDTNAAIFARNSKHPQRRMMSATLSAALIYDNSLIIANVGDNHVYVVFEQDIELLTSTSYKEPPQPEEGELPPLSPDKEPPQPLPTLPKAVGMAKEVEIETFSRRLFANDIVVLCSGGLAGYVNEKEIAKAVTRHTPIQAIPRLISLAAGRGNRDRLSISITRILSTPVTARASKAVALVPPSPNWDDWEISPRPDPLPPPPPPPSISSKPPLIQTPKMRTAKMVNVKPAVSPETAMRIANSLPGIGEKKRWRWQGLALIILVSICFLCTLPWLAWRYLIPPEMMASIPILSNIEGVVREESPTISAITEGATARGGDIQPESTAIADNNSPISTPTTEIQPTATTEPTTSQTVVQPSPTNTPQPALATETPTVAPSPTPSPTSAPTIVLPEGCVSKGRFVRDITVPDGEQISPAETFEKTWLVTNAGDCPWGAGYTVNFMSGDLLSGENIRAIIEVTNPDDNGEITVPMTAPTAPGTYKTVWQLHDINGEPFGPELYIEIEVVASVSEQPAAAPAEAGQELLYDFIANSTSATWSSAETTYTVLETNDINENLDLPAPQGLVAVGQALLRGDKTSEGNVLLTHPHQELGIIEGVYQIDDLPLQPTDTIAATLGFVKLSILSDDGVTFEVVFTPSDGGEEQVILSRNLQYRDSPVTEVRALSGITAGQTGNFSLRVLGGDSLSQDWAVWLDLRLLR